MKPKIIKTRKDVETNKRQVQYTKIVSVASDENEVVIKYRPRGSDPAKEPMVLRITPHDNYIYMSLANMGDQMITHWEHGANIARVFLEKKGENQFCPICGSDDCYCEWNPVVSV